MNNTRMTKAEWLVREAKRFMDWVSQTRTQDERDFEFFIYGDDESEDSLAYAWVGSQYKPQPIASAPTDGTWFLVANSEDPVWHPARNDDGKWEFFKSVSYEWLDKMTHWMPMPTLPFMEDETK